MPVRSAGILLHCTVDGRPEVLLVHPGGPFWRNKDVGVWQIPKGLVEPGENAEAASRREVADELGCEIDGELIALGEIRQTGGKTVSAYLVRNARVEYDIDDKGFHHSSVRPIFREMLRRTFKARAFGDRDGQVFEEQLG